MIYLLLCIICTTCLILAFKIFERRGIAIFPAIVFNYAFATICGFIFLPDRQHLLNTNLLQQPWLPLSLLLGAMFFVVFNLTSITAVRYGMSTASVAMKLGLVFPVLLAFTIYGEPFSVLKLIGILFAFVAVVLSSLKQDESLSNSKVSVAWLPVIVFLGSGTCDALTQLANKKYLGNTGMEEFAICLFGTAAVVGLGTYSIQLVKRKAKVTVQPIIGGMALGVVNYFSFLFMLKALATMSMGSSMIFPLINLGTVLAATLCGFVFFNERLSIINRAGLVFAVISIGVILLSR